MTKAGPMTTDEIVDALRVISQDPVALMRFVVYGLQRAATIGFVVGIVVGIAIGAAITYANGVWG